MNFSIQIPIRQIFDAFLRFFDQLRLTTVFHFIKNNNEIFGISSCLFLLLFMRYKLDKSEKRKIISKIKDLKSNKTDFVEGKVIVISNETDNNKYIALQKSVLEEQIYKSNYIVYNKKTKRDDSKEIKSFFISDDTGSLELNFNKNPENFKISKYFQVENKDNNKYQYFKPILNEGESIVFSSQIAKYINNRDIVRLKIAVPNDSIKLGSNMIIKNDINLIEFHEPSLMSLVKYSNFYRYCYYLFLLANISGIGYFAYKIYNKYFKPKVDIRQRRLLMLEANNNNNNNNNAS